MKIMQVVPNLWFGGAEIMCENLTYALRNRGEEVVVVSLYDERTPISQRMEAAGVKIHYLDKKLGLDVSMVPKLRQLMEQERPDAVHTHLDVIKYAALAARQAGVEKCVHTIHNLAEKEALGLPQKLINKFYFRMGWSEPVALSSLVQNSVGDFYAMDLIRIPVVYNGIDLSRCIPKEDYSRGLTFLHVGRFNEQKNHEGLLRIFQKLLMTHPQCRLKLVGDGDRRPQAEQLARDLGIEEKVEFRGQSDNVYPLFHEADVFVLPSRYEGMPMTLIEAMGTGVPIVASCVGGVPDMLTDGVSALLPPCEEEAILAACCRLAEDEALRRRLGENARKESRRFSAEAMAEAYCRLYEN